MRIKLYSSAIMNSLITILFYMTILLMPYDAIRIMPSVYKPICLIPALFLFILLLPKIFNEKQNKIIIYLIVYVGLTLLFTLINDIFIFKSFFNFFNYFATMGLFFCSFLSLYYCFNYLSRTYDNNKYIFVFFKLVAIAYTLPMFICLIDVLTVYHILPSIFKELIMIVFGGNQYNRITGTSFESSWIVMHLLLASVAFLYMFSITKRKKYVLLLLIDIITFVAAFSLQGFAILFLGIFLFVILNRKKITKLVKTFVALGIIIGIIFLIVIQVVDSDVYYIQRLKHFSNFVQMFQSDLSTFVRVGYPIISIRMFFDYPIIGIGGENFGHYLGNYINSMFPWALNFYGTTDNEVYYTVMNNSGTPKMLFSKILCEFGIITFVFFVMFLLNSIKKRQGNNFTQMLLIFSLCFTLQFDSYCFVLLIIPLAFYSNLKTKNAK